MNPQLYQTELHRARIMHQPMKKPPGVWRLFVLRIQCGQALRTRAHTPARGDGGAAALDLLGQELPGSYQNHARFRLGRDFGFGRGERAHNQVNATAKGAADGGHHVMGGRRYGVGGGTNGDEGCDCEQGEAGRAHVGNSR